MGPAFGWRHFWLSVTAACAIAGSRPVYADPIFDLNIAAGELHEALLELGRQSGVSIVFPKDAAAGLTNGPLHGRVTLAEALRVLIGSHCLTAVTVQSTVIAIRPGCVSPSVAEQIPAEVPGSPADSPPGVEDPPGVEELLVIGPYVTGSRIRNPALYGYGPVDVIDRPEIELGGKQSVGELLRYVPAVAGNSTSTLVSNGGDGTATVTLRGLPSSNTLVLLNGRRTNPDGLFGTSVDLNTIPIGLVERVEILKDGASAIYGSDAIAGVVNLILREDVEGFHIITYLGQSTRSDLRTLNGDLIWGRVFDGGHLTIGATFYDQSAVYSRNRALSSSSDDRDRGGIDKRSSATSPGRIGLPDGSVILADEDLDGSDPGHFRPATDEDRFEYRDYTTSIVPSTRWSLFLNAEGQASESVSVFLESLYTQTRAANTLAPTPLFTGFEATELTVAAGNPYNPFGVDIEDARRRFVELPPRQQFNDTTSLRWVAGVVGDVGKAHWEVALTNSRSNATQAFSHLLNTRRTQAALGADCVSPCVPLNVFGPAGSIDADMLGYVELPKVKARGRSELNALSLTFDFPLGELPGGPIEVVTGAQYREEFLNTAPDDDIANSNTIGGENFSDIRGERDVWSGYMEAHLPIVAERRFVHALVLNAAARYSRYSDFGSTRNPRFELAYAPTANMALRASWSRGFRAPSLKQLFASETESFEQLNDPCALEANVGLLPGCIVQSDPTLVQFLTIMTGNETLEPERATTQNYGLVVTPLKNLDLSADYYRIRAHDVVESNGQFIVNQNARSLAFPELLERDTNGNISLVTAPELNIGRRDVHGWDFTARYDIRFERGRLRLTSNATHIQSFRDQFDPTTPVVEHAGTFSDEASSGNGALPDWKINAGLEWLRGGWHLAYSLHYVSSLQERVPIEETLRKIQPWRVHNLQFRYFGKATAWTELRVGINNLFDQAPPFAAAAFNDSYDARTYDITGRYLYFQIRKGFGA